jgi:hypothetical protein
MNLIHDLKKMGIPQSEVEEAFKSRGLKPPSKPTIRKYYNMAGSLSTEHMVEAYAKEKAFDEPHCKRLIIRTLEVNGLEITISSIYDLLQEKLVETGVLKELPGNEQTLRNYCKYLKQEGLVPSHRTGMQSRTYDEVVTPPPGKQMQLDYGVMKIRNNEHFHFIALLLRHSRMLYVKAQDHHFNAAESCNAIYGFFTLLGGRVEQLVIDQDACLVYEETYGEITTTRVFGDFLREQDLKLFVCRKADPETKGAIENTVKFVKLNYLPSRMDWPLQNLISRVPEWCKRKNERIHAAELWKIDDHFFQYEKEKLLPINPSLYDSIGTTKKLVSVSKTRQARYRTNKFIMPREFDQREVWIKDTGSKLLFYKTEKALNPVASYDLPSSKVKNQTFEHEEFKKRRSVAYKDVYYDILKHYHATELKHYLNGLHKEHENSRYLRDKFLGFRKMLQERNPSQEELEAVMTIACQGFRYQLSQLKAVWDAYRIEHDIPIHDARLPKQPDQYDHQVEKRSTEHYSSILSSLMKEAP